MFSQRDEEKYILEYFKDFTGSFLDLGAYDGKTFSNTHQLALNNWKGVCVEASPSLHSALSNLYKNNLNIKIVKKGVGVMNGVLPFYDFNGDAIGSFDRTHADKWARNTKTPYKIIDVEVISLDELLLEIGHDFNFINIDVEGWSQVVLQHLPFEKLIGLKMICVEYDNQLSNILQFMNKQGFTLLHKTSENILLVR